MTARPLPRVSSVVVLDLDDTLYLERDYVRSGMEAVGRWIQQEFGIGDFRHRALDHFERGERRRIFDRVLHDLELEPTPPLIERMVQIYREHFPTLHLAPDAAAFLARRRTDRALALLSDGFLVSQRNKIGALGLDRLDIWPLVCTDAWGRHYWKPHCRGFQHIQAHHGLPADRCLYVADNPAKDFIAPLRLGWRTIQILRPERVHLAAAADVGAAVDHVIESFDELTEDRLDAIFSASSRNAA